MFAGRYSLLGRHYDTDEPLLFSPTIILNLPNVLVARVGRQRTCGNSMGTARHCVLQLPGASRLPCERN